MALQNCNIYTIDKYLQDRYYIPNYQREYSWEEGELTDFWDDLETLIANEDITHFFGQVVIHDDVTNRKKFIIDGQQRTITSTIFLRALQLAFKKIDDEYKIEKANQYNSKISYKYMCDMENDYKLVLGEADDDYFRDNIQAGDLENCRSDKVRSHERMRKAFLFFAEKIDSKVREAENAQAKLDILSEILLAFTERFKVLCMEATELSEAFIIFETLNARGKDLETADLLKNFIFSKASNDIDLAQAQWKEMLSKLDKADTTKYIRHYWNSCHAFTREKELYKSINKDASSQKAAAELLEDLKNLASYYHDLACPMDGMIGFDDDKILTQLIILKTLKASTYYPVILAMLKTDKLNNERDIERVLKSIVIYVFRNFTICNKVANTAEVFFAKTARRIYDQDLITTEQIIDTINSEIVDDDEFMASFTTWTASSSNKEIVRYVLRNIHYHYDKYKELNLDNMSVHIEHIMPQDSEQWHIDEETHEKYLWRLGNLALLSGPINSSISNKPFSEKKIAYADSEIIPNKELYNHDVWGIAEIEERQRKFAEVAKEIWKKQ